MQYRSGSMLPPPLDAYTSDSSTGNPIAKVPSSVSSISFSNLPWYKVLFGLCHPYQRNFTFTFLSHVALPP